ncbi:hypothetical protein A2U01_0027462, partial [Trifolium medium]|nr:hypothetical protein [Trifolium medium]
LLLLVATSDSIPMVNSEKTVIGGWVKFCAELYQKCLLNPIFCSEYYTICVLQHHTTCVLQQLLLVVEGCY